MRALKTGQPVLQHDLELLKVSGEGSVIRVNASPIRDRDGNTIAGAVAFEDVTRRLAFEKALRESEEKFRKLAEVAPCSGSAELPRIFGFTESEALGSSFDFLLAHVHPEDRALGMGSRKGEDLLRSLGDAGLDGRSRGGCHREQSFRAGAARK